MKYVFFVLILVAVAFEIAADVFFKEWAMNNKSRFMMIGLAVDVVGMAIFAYSLKFDYLAKAICMFTVVNLIIVALIGVFYFKENLSLVSKIGIMFGIVSVLLLQMQG